MDTEEGCIKRNLRQHIELGEDDLQLLEELEQAPREVARRSQLWKAGDVPEVLYTLKRGWAYSFHCSKGGGRQVLEIFLPGDLVGIREVTFNAHYTGVEMLTDGIVCPFPAQGLREACQRSSTLGLAMHASASHQQAVITERLVNVLSHDAKSRIAHFALEIYYRLERIHATDGSSFTLPLTQRLFSLMLGLTEVHVSRTLTDLAEDGLIHKRRNAIRILDFERLSALAGFVPEHCSEAINPLLRG
ncbi:Crp/Fnr family transcriptional regulator [Modicisalibacter radicis]|uniref:Crp/Fnr family transcriptional regulator n=1 Tax=Halomonas sp. EAR18 TaxID=2518972 RepID=UPI00109C38FA|nr:Crp/Fnr family transcriptional regulator [Halomonas sp. EAR18]